MIANKNYIKIAHLTAIFTLTVSLLYGCGGGSDSSSTTGGQQDSGTAGSMARFQVIGNYLYAITTDWRLSLFDISTPSSPSKWLDINLPSGIETLYNYNDYLFIGANDGVRIYNNQDPAAPFFISNFRHVQSCDPVVVENNYAYATLRGGSGCRFGVNRLDVLDVSDIYNPTLVNSVRMSQPKGLGIRNGKLFVCDRNQLVSYNATDPLNLIEVNRISLYDCFDVIPAQTTLIVSHGGGISQYDYSTVPIKFISDIATLR